MATLFPPFDPDGDGPGAPRRPRLRSIPLRAIAPSLVTLIALCAGLTAIRMAMEGRYAFAIAAVVAAAVLDAVDGRVARYLRVTSRFGAELDSLTDFVNFGVTPAILLYAAMLDGIGAIGWTAALVFAIAAALRLARFNAMIDAPRPDWQGNFFVGVPAPAGAITALLPLHLQLSGFPIPDVAAPAVAVYLMLIAVLMVSRVPTFSGKKLGQRLRRDLVLPLLLAFVLFTALLVSFPFEVLAIGSVVYLAVLPFGWQRWNRLAREHGQPSEEVLLGPNDGDDGHGEERDAEDGEAPVSRR